MTHMIIEKLEHSTLSPAWFSQIVEIEKNCGLEPYTPQMLMESITNLDTFACLDGGTVAGFITIHPSTQRLGGGLYIVNLNVALPYRRQGIAQKLMLAACSQYGISHAGQLVTLDVSKTNTAAKALYRKLGFTVSDLPSGNGDTDVVMIAQLNALIGSVKTQHLVLKPLSAQDKACASLLLQNNDIKKTYMVPDLTSGAAEKLFHRLMELSYCAERYVRGIYCDGSLIGFMNDTKIEGQSIELGWVVHPDHQNCGYATEAVKAAITDLFARGFTQITAGAFQENASSIRVMQKAGMELLDKTEVIEYRGQSHHCVYYGIHRERESS